MSKLDDSIIDLRSSKKDDDAEFRIEHLSKEEAQGASEINMSGKVMSKDERDLSGAETQSASRVKVKFDKFVSLVASHAYEEIFNKYADEDIILSTDLLTDLANSHEEKSEKKVPLMFLGGIILGGILMWFLLRT